MTDDRVRSYQRAYTSELLIHSFLDRPLWRPIPARAIIYAAVLEAVLFVASHLIVTRTIIQGLGWEISFLLLPLGLAALLSMARVEGRRFHVAFRARLQALRTARYLAGGWWPVQGPGRVERFGKVKVARRREGRR